LAIILSSSIINPENKKSCGNGFLQNLFLEQVFQLFSVVQFCSIETVLIRFFSVVPKMVLLTEPQKSNVNAINFFIVKF
tara:strand:+ start:837 stop:1073 length:237 start_codon:yes stop_codon:yes gene_type:complete